MAVLQQLQQARIAAIIALPLRGSHLQSLCNGKESRWAQHTLRSREDGAVTVKIAVVQYLRKAGSGPRRVDHAIFQLRRLQTFLLTAVMEIYGRRTSLDLRSYRPHSPAQSGDML